jgi:hypothetical protein
MIEQCEVWIFFAANNRRLRRRNAPATTSKETIEDLFLGRWRPDVTGTLGWCTGYKDYVHLVVMH